MLKKKKTTFKRLVIFSITSMFIFTAIQLSIASPSTITNNVSIKPRYSFQKIENFQPERIIFTGDLFHSYENQEHALFAKWRKAITANSIHLVKGNHDLLPNKVYDELGLVLHENIYTTGPFVLVHDLNSLPEGSEKGYRISGHIHPGIRISGQGKQSLSFPCFYFSKKHAILPAFSKFTGFVVIETLKTDTVFAIVKGNKNKGENSVIVKIQ